MATITLPVYGGMFDSTEVVEEIGGFPRGDKAVDSAFFAKMISCFYKDGVLGADSYAVTPGGGLTVRVSAGIAWIRGYMAWQKEAASLTLTAGTTWTILLRLDQAAGEFHLIATDNAAGLPSDTDNQRDLILAEITVPSGASSVSASSVLDTRADASKCGVVTSTVDALGTVANASNANMLGGYTASAFLRRSGGAMTGPLTSAADTTGAAVVRNIAYGTQIPAALQNGDLFVLIGE